MGSFRRVALIGDSAARADLIQQSLREVGENDVETISPCSGFVSRLVARAPSQTIVDLHQQDICIFEAMRMIGPSLTCPVVLVVDQADRQLIRLASEAGLLLVATDDQSNEALKAKVLLIVRYLATLSNCHCDQDLYRLQLGNITAIELAKAAIMRRSNLQEPQAYKLLRDTAMNTRRSIADVAAAVIEPDYARPQDPSQLHH